MPTGALRRTAGRDDLPVRVENALGALGVGPDVPIGVACSGGADSIALLHLVAGRRGVTALHVDHRMRDDSSVDADFVRDAAARLGVPVDMRRLDRAPQTEAEARDARYLALTAAAQEHGLRFVLTAHTSDDQAETVLLRLMRGDTLDAIAPARGSFVRPLLDVTRAELRVWLRVHDVAWREDPTNADVRFERNWVRHVLLPQMRERRPGVDGVLARTAERARDDAAALDAIAASVVADAPADDVGIFVSDVARLPSGVLTRVIRRTCRRLGHDPGSRDVGAIATMTSNVRSGEVDVFRLDGGLAFVRSPMPVPPPVAITRGAVASPDWGVRVAARDHTEALHIRSRRPGDRTPTDAGTRKVQDVLVDAKVPRLLRPLVPIVANDRGAVAVVGPRLQSGCQLGAEPFEPTWSRARVWESEWTR